MKFVTNAIPGPSPGIKITEPSMVVPDQSLSLKEILERFVRHEALPVGMPGSYGSDSDIDPESDSEFNIDQEKAKYWDLTEKDEFKAKVDGLKKRVEESERKREAAEAEKKKQAEAEAFEKRVSDEVAKRQKQGPGGVSI